MLCQGQRCEDIDLEIPLNEVDGDLGDRTALSHAGIIDQDVDVPGTGVLHIIGSIPAHEDFRYHCQELLDLRTTG